MPELIFIRFSSICFKTKTWILGRKLKLQGQYRIKLVYESSIARAVHRLGFVTLLGSETVFRGMSLLRVHSSAKGHAQVHHVHGWNLGVAPKSSFLHHHYVRQEVRHCMGAVRCEIRCIRKAPKNKLSSKRRTSPFLMIFLYWQPTCPVMVTDPSDGQRRTRQLENLPELPQNNCIYYMMNIQHKRLEPEDKYIRLRVC